MSVVLSDIPEIERTKLHFIFKLWLVTNDTSKPYIRWNRAQTVLIVDLELMMFHFLTDVSTIFTCQTIENFIWLLYKYAFEKCTKYMLEEAEHAEFNPCCMIFRHPQFVGSNSMVFDAWLSNPAVRVHEPNEKGRCTLPSRLGFIVRENIPEFSLARMQVKFAMMHLELRLRQPLSKQKNAAIVVPEPHIDRPVMSVPQYLETKEIEGNYGPVSVSELKKCLGNMITVSYDDLDQNGESENVSDNGIIVEEVPPVLADNETSRVHEGDAQETAIVELEAPITLQFNDLRELYESVNFWTSEAEDGSVIEYHEIYDIKNVFPEETEETEPTSAGNVENSIQILPIQLTENGQSMDEGMMSAENLTESMKACLPAIDFD
ncbi:uncharacterized protein LOC126562484 [Anopheles maculipalpis]|uniref:uncharacterized protein LOC126562484 n=1 Tax=Anopheles maculipalpis TaxID=1496333 RepID=UPI002158BFA6|nr:uncharacterized protein LOC126562484 [Anopheles maculipalpis]